MDRLHPFAHHFSHPFAPHLSRIASIAIGFTLLWYGTSQPSLPAMVGMLLGLIAVVRAVAVPRPSLQTVDPTAYPDVDTRISHVRS